MSNKIKVIFFDLGDTLVTGDRRWIPGAPALIASLRDAGFRLGIISNTAHLTRPQILEILPPDFDLSRFEADLVLFSSEAGVAKPAPAIFRLAVNRASTAADHCLYCSEDAVETLVAQSTGMLALRVPKSAEGELGILQDFLVKFESQLAAS